MKSSALGSQFCLSSHSKLISPSVQTSFLPFRTPASPSKSPTPCAGKRARNYSKYRLGYPSKTSPINKPLILEEQPTNIERESKKEVLLSLSDGYSRFVLLGAISLGMAMFVAGMNDQKAMALGPEGPMVEEFWDNVRRYGLYILTVSTGVIYTIFEPIYELLKNPITAILILVILGGSVYIVSQVVSAMVGVSEFPYEYAY